MHRSGAWSDHLAGGLTAALVSHHREAIFASDDVPVIPCRLPPHQIASSREHPADRGRQGAERIGHGCEPGKKPERAIGTHQFHLGKAKLDRLAEYEAELGRATGEGVERRGN